MIWPFRKPTIVAPTMAWANEFKDSHALVYCPLPVKVYRFDGRYWAEIGLRVGVLVKGTGVWNHDMHFLPEDMLRPKPGYFDTLRDLQRERLARQASSPTPPASPDAQPRIEPGCTPT